jgi:LEA14-like dessication related protein
MALKPNFFNAVAVAALVWRVYEYAKKQYKLLNKWDYKVLGLRLRGLTANYIDLDVVVDFKNLAGVSATVSNFEMDVYVEGLLIGSAEKKELYTFPKYGTKELTFTVRSYLSKFGQAISKVLPILGRPGEIRVRIKGQFYTETVPGVFVPVRFDFTDSALNLYSYFK